MSTATFSATAMVKFESRWMRAGGWEVRVRSSSERRDVDNAQWQMQRGKGIGRKRDFWHARAHHTALYIIIIIIPYTPCSGDGSGDSGCRAENTQKPWRAPVIKYQLWPSAAELGADELWRACGNNAGAGDTGVSIWPLRSRRLV